MLCQSPPGAETEYLDAWPVDVRQSTKVWMLCQSPPERKVLLVQLCHHHPILLKQHETILIIFQFMVVQGLWFRRIPPQRYHLVILAKW